MIEKIKPTLIYILPISYFIAGIYIDDFFLNTIWGALFLLANIFIGVFLWGLGQVLLIGFSKFILSILTMFFNVEAINLDSFYSFEEHIEEYGIWYFGIPIFIASAYVWYSTFFT